MGRSGGRMSENDMLIEMRRLRRELAPIRDAEARRARTSSFARPHHTPVSLRALRARAGTLLILAIAAVALFFGWLAALFLEGAARTLFDGLLPDPVRVTVNALFALIF